MEFEDVSEKVAWEARRVAAAFGVKKWLATSTTHSSPPSILYQGKVNEFYVECTFDEFGLPVRFQVDYLDDHVDGHRYRSTRVFQNDQGQWIGHFAERSRDLMARSLYCLGFEDEHIIVEYQFPYILSAHEKLELRLSLPREFWPQK